MVAPPVNGCHVCGGEGKIHGLTCTNCDGEGEAPPETCNACAGLGDIPDHQRPGYRVPCPKCGGLGYF